MTEGKRTVVRRQTRYILNVNLADTVLAAVIGVFLLLMFKCNGVVLWGPNELTFEQSQKLRREKALESADASLEGSP